MYSQSPPVHQTILRPLPSSSWTGNCKLIRNNRASATLPQSRSSATNLLYSGPWKTLLRHFSKSPFARYHRFVKRGLVPLTGTKLGTAPNRPSFDSGCVAATCSSLIAESSLTSREKSSVSSEWRYEMMIFVCDRVLLGRSGRIVRSHENGHPRSVSAGSTGGRWRDFLGCAGHFRRRNHSGLINREHLFCADHPLSVISLNTRDIRIWPSSLGFAGRS